MKQALEVSAEIGISLDRVIKEALISGLSLLAESEGAQHKKKDSRVTWQEPEKEFIRENWQKMSDAEMANHIPHPALSIAQMRNKLGLKKPRGRPKKRVELKKPKIPKVRDKKGKAGLSEEQEEFLKKNWSEMDDVELAEHLDIAVWRAGRERRRLELKRKRGRKKGQLDVRYIQSVKARIDPLWLKRVLLKDGLTLEDVAKQIGGNGKRVTRERIRQIAAEWGISISSDRTPQWYENHSGVPGLADKQWLEEQLRAANGMYALSRKINVSGSIIRIVARLLGIDKKLLHHRTKTVKVVCSFCGNPIETRPYLIKRGQKHHFCNKKCQGKWLAVNFGWKKGESPKGVVWTKEEDEFLKANFMEMTDGELAKEMENKGLGDRTQAAVALRRSRLNLLKMRIGGRKKWERDEKVFLRANYLIMSDKKMAEKMGRTRGSVFAARIRRGLKKRKG